MKLSLDPTINPALPEQLPARLLQLAGLYNARPIRERLLLLAVGLALVYALLDQAWVAPAQRRAALAQPGNAAQSDPAATATRTRELLQRLKAIEQAGEQAQQTARSRAGDARQALQEQAQAMVSAEQMPALLRDLMHGRRACTGPAPCSGGPVIRALKSIGEREPFLTDGAGADGQTVTLWRHGVELVLEGSFAELDAYLSALESLPRRLRHGEMRLEVGKYPTATLTLQLYTLSLDRTWLQI